MSIDKNYDGLIVFDFDGVLDLGSQEAYEYILRETLLDSGVELPEDEVIRRINASWGSQLSNVLRELLREHPELYPKARDVLQECLWEDFPEMIRGIPGAPEKLGELALKYSLAINTAADRKPLVGRVMPKLGIDPELFAYIFTADDINNPNEYKPEPHGLRLIMKELGFLPAQTTMVGDSDSDVLTAQFSSVEPIVVLTGNLDIEEADELGVKYIIEDVTKIDTALGQIGLKPVLTYDA